VPESSCAALVLCEPALSESERVTLVGFLAGYRGQTRVAYTLDLRQFTAWCLQHGCRLFDVRRMDIDGFARDLEVHGKARATVARRLCTICGFYRYAEEQGVIDHSPAVHIRLPRVDYESHVLGLDRNEVGALLVAAGLSSPGDHNLVSLFALNGLRVSEAVGINIDNLGPSRCHSRRGSPAPSTWRSASAAPGPSSSAPTVSDWIDTPLAGSSVASLAEQASSSPAIWARSFSIHLLGAIILNC
jgi:Phage integrase, N-terminal SAM-like domain